MLSITFDPPAGGRNRSAPRGVRTAVLLQGRWRSDDDAAPQVTLQVYGRHSSATVNSPTANSTVGTWRATVELDCPSRNAVQASITAWVAGGSGHRQRQTAIAAPLFLRVRDPQNDPAYHLQGTVVDHRRAPVPGVLVTVFDRDRGSRNDRLGSARSADDGSFELHFTESLFSETPEERGPDLVFTASSASGQALQAGVMDVRGGWLPNADAAPPPFLLHVSPATGFVLGAAVRAKWQALGGSAGRLGLPQGDESALPGGPTSPGFQAVFAGGTVVRLLAFETSAVLGPLHSGWQAQGGGAGWLG